MKHYLKYFEEVSLRKWDLLALSDLSGDSFSYRQVAGEIEKLHILYKELGLSKGDKIALCGRNSARWAIAFLANATYGAVSVPILYDFTPEAVLSLTNHSESSILFTDSRTFNKFDVSDHANLIAIVNLEDYSPLWTENGPAFETLDERYAKAFPGGIDSVNFHYNIGNIDDLAVINYTSGTTGEPKGVMLTFRSLSANVNYGLQNVPVTDLDCSLSMLPLAHMFGLVFEFLYSFCGGSHVFFLGKAPTPSALMAAFAQVNPYLLATVPLVMEKIVKGKIMPVFDKAVVRILSKIPGIRQMIYGKARKGLMNALGGKIRAITIGGAALNPSVEKVLRDMKVPYSVGYGMTECGPLVAYCDWKEFRRGSCGRELGEYSHIRIDSEDPQRIPGEIQVKGDNVMVGYYKNEKATQLAFTKDGWLRTGDLGVLSEDGSVTIKGRSKCMILSANGQNIYPEELEAIINSQEGVSESLVVSRKSQLTALIFPVQGVHIDIVGLKQRINALLPSYSRLSEMELMDRPFEHTPKQSIKRTLYQ